MVFLYHIAVNFYRFGIYLASFRSAKAKQWIEGRKNWRSSLPPAKTKERYWFHCASLGEFEQARPLIEYYHTQGIEIGLSFFSPSGYNERKNYSLASWVGYLPMDGPKAAHDFVAAMDADRVFFVKYEFWYYFLMEIKDRAIPAYLISARFRSSQPFFQWYGSLHRSMLKAYTHIFTQDRASVDLLKEIGITHTHFAGDTRFDRVIQMPQQRKEIALIADFCKDQFAVVAGSCWPPEEELIAAALPAFPSFLWVLVPHDVDEAHIQKIEARFAGNCIRYSALEKGQKTANERVLIVDKIGLLGNIYPYGKVSLVGGGFSNALHNILEPAVWGIPVLYGNNTKKYPEGQELEEAGGGSAIASSEQFIETLRLLKQDDKRTEQGSRAYRWVEANVGACARIRSTIE